MPISWFSQNYFSESNSKQADSFKSSVLGMFSYQQETYYRSESAFVNSDSFSQPYLEHPALKDEQTLMTFINLHEVS